MIDITLERNGNNSGYFDQDSIGYSDGDDNCSFNGGLSENDLFDVIVDSFQSTYDVDYDSTHETSFGSGGPFGASSYENFSEIPSRLSVDVDISILFFLINWF